MDTFRDGVAPTRPVAKPDLLRRCAKSLIRVSVKGVHQDIGFYSQTEYDEWCAERAANGKTLGTAKYFKGLGTSYAALAKEYCKNLKAKTIVMRPTGQEAGCEELDMAFDKKRADNRKQVQREHRDTKA